MVGYSLIERCSAGELRAILLHELGHLEDRLYLPGIKRNAYLGDACLLCCGILVQFKSLTASIIALAVSPVLLYLYGGLNRRRRRAEFAADLYVREEGGEVAFQELLSGLEKIRVMNGLDPDFCKKTGMAHLDADERERMVATGRFEPRRGQTARAWLGKVAVLAALTAAMVIGFRMADRWFLSPGTYAWRELHDTFHAQFKDRHYEQALATALRALEVSRAHFGEDSSKTLIILNDLSELHIKIRQWGVAEQTARKAVQVSNAIFDRPHKDAVRCRANLGRVCYGQYNFSEAEVWFKEALELQTALGGTDPQMIRLLSWLASTYRELGKYDGAVESYGKMLSLYDLQGDETTPDAIETLIELAQVHLDNRAPAESDNNVREALRRAGGVYGSDRGKSAAVLVDVAEFYARNSNYDRAEKYFLEGVEILQAREDRDNGDFRRALSGLGDLYVEAQRYEQAERRLLAVLRMDEEHYGSTSTEIMRDLRRLAECYEQQGDIARAASFYRRIAEITDNTPSDRMEIKSRSQIYEKLLLMYRILGNDEEAAKIGAKLREFEKKS